MSRFIFELAGAVAWPESGLEDQILYASTVDFAGRPKMLNRIPPELHRGPDGTLWLGARGRLARLRGTDAADPFPLAGLALDTLVALAPMPDKGLAALGQEATKNVLARLGETGQPIWRRTDLPALQAHLTQAQLLADPNGSIVLYTVSTGVGQIAEIDPNDGSASVVASFESNPPHKVWLRRDSLYWVDSSDAGSHRWISQHLPTGEKHAVGKPPLQHLILNIQGPLPDGGALLAVAQRGELIWMGAEGQEMDRLALAGAARADDELVIATRDHDLVQITRWRGGQAIGDFRVESSGRSARLIAAEESSYFIRDSRKLVVVDSTGRQIDEISSGQEQDERMKREGNIAIAGPAIEPAGAVLLAGADAQGVYVIKITRAG